MKPEKREDDQDAKPQAVGLAAFQGTRTHFILHQHGLMGNPAGLKGMMLTYVEWHKSMALYGQHPDDLKIRRKKRTEQERFLDQMMAFLSLQRHLSWELSILAANIENKIAILDNVIDAAKGRMSEGALGELKELRNQAVRQKDKIENAADKVAKSENLNELKDVQTEVERRKNIVEEWMERFRERRAKEAAFSHEAHIRPETGHAREESSFYRSAYSAASSNIDPDDTPAEKEKPADEAL